MQWYYVTNGQRQGPVGDEHIHQLVANGSIQPSDLVWNEGMGQEWKAAGQVPELAGSFTGTLQPPPAPPVGEPVFPVTPGSLTPNRDLMAQARACLEGNWGVAIAVVVVINLISGALGFIPGVGPHINPGIKLVINLVIALVIAGPLQLGLVMFFLRIARQTEVEFGLAFGGFKYFGTAFLTLLLVAIFTFLWTLLLIIPGIIASLRYSLTFYILADHPELGPMEAIDQSKAMMKGNKWKLFCLGWRFFGWNLLGILTCGIGLLWVLPYLQTSMARFYEDVRGAQSA
jgi:uncharacterized membrane protein